MTQFEHENSETGSASFPEACILDYADPGPLAHAKPLSVSYYQEEIPASTWRKAYTEICRRLVRDYPEVFVRLRGRRNVKKSSRLVFAEDEVPDLTAPFEIAPGFYVESAYGIKDSVQRIRLLLDVCHVPYEKVIIRFFQRAKAPCKESEAPVVSSPNEAERLYRFVRIRVSRWSLDPCVSLLYCIVRHMDEDGCADSEEVLKTHNKLTGQLILWIPGSDEYRELLREGFLYLVKVNAGKNTAFKFQPRFSDLLKKDRYETLLSILKNAPAIRDLADDSESQKGAKRAQKTPVQKLSARISREIGKRTYLSDIPVSEEEYELLRSELNRMILRTRQVKRLEGTPLFAAGLVQVALRIYQDGNFWSRFYQEIGLSKGDGVEQRRIGTEFTRVLKEHDRFLLTQEEGKQNQYVQNILLHCFVTDPYLDSYFTFLYAVYSSLLDRDLSQLDREAMNALIERADRSALLTKSTAEALRANPRGAKIRIRNHLKLLDKLFWNPDYSRRTSNRIFSKLQLWAHQSDRMILESASGRSGAGKGKKRFSKPYLFFDPSSFSFRLVLPQQTVIGDDPDLYWSISNPMEKVIRPEIAEAVIGYKVQEQSIPLSSWKDLLGEFRIRLNDSEGHTVRSFSLPKTDVRFFDEDGYLIFTNNLRAGTTYTLTRKAAALRSGSPAETYDKQDMLLSVYRFEDGDILLLPDGHAVSIGGDRIESGLAGGSAVADVTCLLDSGESVSLYPKFPRIILRTQVNKAPGTVIQINSVRFSLNDIASMRFPIDDRSEDTGYWIEPERAVAPKDGLYTILADIPDGSTYTWKFLLVNGFRLSFDDAPYIFEPRGVVRFQDGFDLTSLEKACSKDPSGNIFQFDLAGVGRRIDFSLRIGGSAYLLKVRVPALFTSFTGEKWSAERPAAIWHSDLPDTVCLSWPEKSLVLFTEEASDDLLAETREKEYRRTAGESYMTCDIRWFKSHLDCGSNISVLYLRAGTGWTELLRVIRHSIPTSCSISEINNGKAIRVHASILGKGTYYADIFYEDRLLKEKLPLENGQSSLDIFPENGQYAVELFETEEDDSGFGDAGYYSIGKFYNTLVNPYDMSHRSFQVLYIEKDDDANRILDLSYDYFVEDLARTGKQDTYTGMMVAENRGEKLAAFPVSVLFLDPSDPNLVSISFTDEYGDDLSFLYDTKRRGILKEENPKLPKLTCYRRYTELDPDGDLFRVEFAERKRSDYGRIPSDLVFEESSYEITFKTSVTKIANKKPNARDVTWNKAACPYVMQTHIGSIDGFAQWTKQDLQARYRIPDPIIDSIEGTLAFYGVYFKRPAPGTQTGMNAEPEPAPAVKSAIEKKVPPAPVRKDPPPPVSMEESSSPAGAFSESEPVESLRLSRMTENLLKQAGYTKIEKLLSLYKKKGPKGFGSIPKCNAEMQKELLTVLKRLKLI